MVEDDSALSQAPAPATQRCFQKHDPVERPSSTSTRTTLRGGLGSRTKCVDTIFRRRLNVRRDVRPPRRGGRPLSYKVFLPGRLDPIEWSQAAWRLEGNATVDDCDQALIHDVLVRNLPADGLIADAGCGTAKWASYLRRRGYRVLGLEISRNATAIARERDPALPLLI